jgi:hypothetical protein
MQLMNGQGGIGVTDFGDSDHLEMVAAVALDE